MKIGAPATSAVPADAATAARDKKLRNASQQMEGQFIEQMYKSMRDTVPTDGMFDGGSGEQMFTEMMDQHVAADTPLKWQHGLSEAIFRQMRDAVLRQHVPASTGAQAAAATTDSRSRTSASGIGES